ncbi:O-antigen ligase family protein [Olleya namhaensis]|uniref:O-antigen ligase family protein n=1 Tax=Olleya namhaensis TaxID=1144750 RepID=UPI002492AF84|nr:O-antigen ligase family protein [Olleya namhaensis]
MFERKAIFLALPLVFSILKPKDIHYRSILKLFVYGCIAAYILSLVIALYNSISFNPFVFDVTLAAHKANELTNPNASSLLINNFLSVNFALDMNPTALAMYFSMSIAIMQYLKEEFSKNTRLFFSILLIVGILQLGSVLGFIMLVFVLIALFKPLLAKPMIAFVFFSFLVTLVLISQKDNQTFVKTSEIERLDNRVIIWYTVLNSISFDNILFGTGVKKAQKMLDKNYPKEGDFGFASQIKKLDSHNMYLQLILEVGLLGLIVFIICIYRYLKQIKIMPKQYQNLCFIFLGLVLFLKMVESALNIYIGLSFFVFFYVLSITFTSQKCIAKK